MRLNIEPLSKNSFMFLFDLKSGECEDKKERQTIKTDDLSLSVHQNPRNIEPMGRLQKSC